MSLMWHSARHRLALAILLPAVMLAGVASAHPHGDVGAAADRWLAVLEAFAVPAALHPERFDFGREDDGGCDGWGWLAEGEPEAALEAFAWDASTHPRRGGPKVGYAVAALLLDEPGRALWAFRRAFQRDAEGAGRVRLAPAVARQVRDKLDGVRDPERGPYDRAGAAFVLAASHVLLGELETARSFADYLMLQDDPPPDVRALDRWLGSRIDPGSPAAR